MGLTLHYTLYSPGRTSRDEARYLVEQLRAKAQELPFRLVTKVFELEGEACEFEHGRKDVPLPVLLAGGRYLEQGEENWVSVPPTGMVAFLISVGEGCEPAVLGLARYPDFVVAPNGERMETDLAGWSWQSFCKTQYASNPKIGGQENFLRCHLNLIKLLDFGQSLGLVDEVRDEGEYWEHRDLTRLCDKLHEYNALIAGFAGKLKDQMQIEAPITAFPNFEHLEAKGQAMWGDREEDFNESDEPGISS